MKLLQVKEYHRIIADKKKAVALDRWKRQDNGYGYPVDSMFYFFLEKEFNQGLNVERKKGYIAFDKHTAVFGISKEKAEKRFNI